MKKQITMFFTALAFYTRIPCYSLGNFSEEYTSKASRYFPLVGWIVGGFGAATYLLSSFIVPQPIAILLSIISTILITGAFHEDGLADSCDGFGAGRDKEHILKIMKDSSIGTYGVIGLILMLSLKYLTLLEIKPAIIPLALIAAHSISRFTAISFMFTHDYARKNDSTSKSIVVTDRFNLIDLAIAGSFGILPIMLLGYPYLLLLIPIFFIRQLISIFLTKKLDGYTGDSLGAVQQIIEVSFYILILVALPWKYI
ncbi:MAG: hypothetical protein A2287_01970 [Candidatus Melainabacteria bacterium RIFOXYA12_FULL_32_12]|nr:MAG: hypothetical protein A2287_01970 [Candidatus Melainabacteria bacterium RIFOXYA12_FULL_32_12]